MKNSNMYNISLPIVIRKKVNIYFVYDYQDLISGILVAPTKDFCPSYIVLANRRLTRNSKLGQWVETVVTGSVQKV